MSFDISIFSSSKTSDDVAFKEVKEFIEKNPTKLNETIKKGSIGGISMKGNLLHFSCYWNNLPKVVSYLLSKNADVTKCFIEFNPSGNGINSMNGLTAKKIAKKKGFGNIVSLFEQYEREPALTEKTNKISNPILGQVKEKPDPVLQPIPQPKPVPVVKPDLKKKPSLKTQPVLFPDLKKKPSPIPQPKPVPVVKPSPNPQPVKEKKSDPALQPIPQPKPVPVVKPPNPQPESVVAAHLKALGLDQFLESFDNIGVKSIEDILLLEEGDWKHMNIPPFQKNKILASIPKKGIAKDTTTNMHKNKENVGVYCIPVALLVISVPVVTVVYDHITTRATELYNEPQILNPIIGLLDIPMCSFDEIVQSLEKYVPGIENFSYTCTMFANNINNNKKQKLTNDEISSINLYTCESNPRENSIYFILNKALRDQDRMALKPFFPYLRLLLRSMSKLPKCSPGTVIWRGVQTNVSSDYIKGKKIIWWGLSSCTKDMDALDTFLGKNTERTLFSVQINSAIEISQFSAHPKEEEVLVFPCVTFEVQNVYSPSQGLWIVQLKEIFSPGKLIKGFDFLGM